MNGWISVKDVIPDDMSAVMGSFEMDGLSVVAVVTVENGVFIQDGSQAELYGADPLGEIAVQPTHWMPLPYPPES